MIFDPSEYDNKAWSLNGRNAAGVRQIFNDVIDDMSRLVVGIEPAAGAVFAFSKFPALKKRVKDAFQLFADNLAKKINVGTDAAWSVANQKNDAMIRYLNKRTGIPLRVLGLYDPRNIDALLAFQSRKDKGIGLSQRVWSIRQQLQREMEFALDLGLGQGKSAAELSRSVRRYLSEPERLYRRVRDKHGNLVASRAAKMFNPGQGVYRSSYKNAMRLTRTETNMAYREADFQRWSKMPFVIGIQVQLSNNPRHCPTCIALAGKYPKDFKFIGWHPQCRCFATSILMSDKDFDKFAVARLNDEPIDNIKAKGTVRDIPTGAKEWYSDNKKRIKEWSSMPYFLKDNLFHFQG